MDDNMAKTLEQAAAFQKLWSDSFANMAHVWAQFSPASPPIEEAKKLRAGMIKVLSESLDNFMRTPQFLEMIKQSMNGAMQIKSMSREGLHKMHDQLEIPHKKDLDGVLLALRHVERRLLERMEDLDESLEKLGEGAAEVSESLERIEERVEDLEASSSAAAADSAAAPSPVPSPAAAPESEAPARPRKRTTKAAASRAKTGKTAKDAQT